MREQGNLRKRTQRASILHQIFMGILLGILIYVITLLVGIYVG